jgi:Leucine-rich repeat (LRR) protein
MKINLNKTSFGETHPHNVIESLSNCKMLTELRMSHHHLVSAENDLYHSLHQLKNLKYLDLSFNGFGEEDMHQEDTSHLPI